MHNKIKHDATMKSEVSVDILYLLVFEQHCCSERKTELTQEKVL